jgi:hypothetical protein
MFGESGSDYKMRPVCLQSLIYADDRALIVSNEEELQKAVIEWESAINDRGMRINVKKSKVMVITKNKNREPLNITWEEEQFEQVERFEYLGTIVTADGEIDEEINHRVQKANQKCYQLVIP